MMRLSPIKDHQQQKNKATKSIRALKLHENNRPPHTL